MGKEQAEQVARTYIQSHQSSFGNVSKKEIEAAVQKVAGALQGLSKNK